MVYLDGSCFSAGINNNDFVDGNIPPSFFYRPYFLGPVSKPFQTPVHVVASLVLVNVWSDGKFAQKFIQILSVYHKLNNFFVGPLDSPNES